MNLLDLNGEELDVILKTCPEYLKRSFKKANVRINGFRLSKIHDDALLSFTKMQISKENAKVISIVEYKIKLIVNEINDSISFLQNKGFDKDFANAISINNLLKEDFIPIFLKLNYTAKKDIEQLQCNIKFVNRINSHYNLLSEKESKEIEKINSIVVENKKTIQVLKESIEKSNEKYLESIKQLNDELKKKELYINKSLINQSELIKNMEKKYNNEISLKTKMFDDKIFKLEQEIKNKRDQAVDDGMILKTVFNEKFSLVDESRLVLHIDKLKKSFNSCKYFDAFKQYLLEIVYSEKPIFAVKENAFNLTELLSNILSGGNYTIIIVDTNMTYKNLSSKINSIFNSSDSSIILVKGFLNKFDYNILIDELITIDINHKLVFSINNSIELQFMAFDILEKFEFFHGELRNIEYTKRSKILLSEKKLLLNKNYNICLSELGTNLNNVLIVNSDFYGLLCYSILPFILLSEEIDYSSSINKLSNKDIRKKSGIVLYE